VVRSYSSLEELPGPFSELLEDAGRQDAFLTSSWFRNFIRTVITAQDHVRIYCADPGEASEAASGMLFMRYPEKPQSPLAMRRLEALTNYYSCFFAPHLSSSGDCGPTLEAIARAISLEKPRWDAVEVKPLAKEALGLSQLAGAFSAAGFFVETFFCFGNWYLPVNGRTFAEYCDGLPSVLRNTLSRKKKKLEKSGRGKIEIVNGGEELERAIEAYTSVYLASWKQPEPYPDFTPGLIRTFAATGALRLGVAYVDGKPAASQLWLVHNKRALIYKLAYDEAFGDLSVGTILSATLFQNAIDVDKVEEIDYLSGDDNYKKDWMSHRRERWGILALNPRTPRGALAIARQIGVHTVKRAARYLGVRPSTGTKSI
jgi:hypothetical protein